MHGGSQRRRTKGSVLDDLGFTSEIALELKLKAELHLEILRLIKKHAYGARDLEKILQIQQPRVSELMRGKLSVLGIKKLLEYADKLGAYAKITLKEKHRMAA